MSRPFADESVFRAIGHPARRRMLELLRARERPVAELVQSFQMSRQTISHHLRVLRTTGLIHQRRNGKQRVYAVKTSLLADVYKWSSLFAGSDRASSSR